MVTIFTPTPDNPFIINDQQIITPICTRGYDGALIIKIILQKMIGLENVRDQYGISADPQFGDAMVNTTDVTIKDATDEFNKVFGYDRSEQHQNVQTKILQQLG